jgi:hypothetical protein
MNKQLIRNLAVTDGIYDCICDPYDKLENGDYYSSVMVDLERFAELIVRECVGVVENLSPVYKDYRDQIEDAFRRDCIEEIKHKFGIE